MCALVTGVQTCALPISLTHRSSTISPPVFRHAAGFLFALASRRATGHFACAQSDLAIAGASRKSEPFSKGELMRRRTLLAAVPAAALLPTAGLAEGPKSKAAPATPKADSSPPPVWEARAARFVRADVHGGDRVIGASFASRKIGRAHVRT